MLMVAAPAAGCAEDDRPPKLPALALALPAVVV